MRVLAVNVGSSSLKLSVVNEHDEVEEEHQVESTTDPADALRDFVARAGDVGAVAHRLVHQGVYRNIDRDTGGAARLKPR